MHDLYYAILVDTHFFPIHSSIYSCGDPGCSPVPAGHTHGDSLGGDTSVPTQDEVGFGGHYGLDLFKCNISIKMSCSGIIDYMFAGLGLK